MPRLEPPLGRRAPPLPEPPAEDVEEGSDSNHVWNATPNPKNIRIPLRQRRGVDHHCDSTASGEFNSPYGAPKMINPEIIIIGEKCFSRMPIPSSGQDDSSGSCVVVGDMLLISSSFIVCKILVANASIL